MEMAAESNEILNQNESPPRKEKKEQRIICKEKKKKRKKGKKKGKKGSFYTFFVPYCLCLAFNFFFQSYHNPTNKSQWVM